MTPHPPGPQRRSTRLRHHDYASPGAYFVTLCTHQRQTLFGPVTDGILQPTAAGRFIHDIWHALPRHHPHVALDGFVVMPNHLHGILWILTPERVAERLAQGDATPPPTQGPRPALPEIIRGFKSFSARQINQHRGAAGTPVWQRSFHDHVIRERDDLNAIQDYIRRNPAEWDQDAHNPKTQTASDLDAWEKHPDAGDTREGR